MSHHTHAGEAGTTRETHDYECPECGCAFEKAPEEPAVCRCPECGEDVDTEPGGCRCCP